MGAGGQEATREHVEAGLNFLGIRIEEFGEADRRFRHALIEQYIRMDRNVRHKALVLFGWVLQSATPSLPDERSAPKP